MRYKTRGRGRYKKSTNIVRMKFQSFMDISTNDGSMQVITISAGGPEVLRRLAPQFAAYKYYKLGNIAVKLVPATTLPVDPSGLSFQAGEPGVNPWDQLTPGMMRITNGEDVFENISGLTTTQQDAIYKNMLLDPRWFKWMLQSGVKRHAFPKYWQIGQLHQDKWPGTITNVPVVNANGQVQGTDQKQDSFLSGTGGQSFYGGGSSAYGFFQTGHTGVLGWLPTDGLSHIINSNFGAPVEQPLIASPPEVEVFKILLPRAIKTRYAYRMFITETVYFREPIVNYGIVAGDGNMYRPLDVFHYPTAPYPATPGAPVSPDFPAAVSTGGNYGNN